MFAQPAIFCASLAGWAALGAPEGDFMAGHSLGELAALVAAGCLGERDGLELVSLRGRLMQRAGEQEGDGGMLALLGAGAAEHAAELAAGPWAVGGQRQLPSAGRALRRALGAARRGRGRQGARSARDGAAGDRSVPLADDGAGGAGVRGRAGARRPSRRRA